MDDEIETLRREIERLRVAASKDRHVLDTILRDSPHGIIMCDEHGALTMQNPAAERIWAGSATAGTVAEWGQYRGVHPDGRPFAGEDWGMAAVLRDRKPIAAVERHIMRFDGTEGWLLASSTPLVDADGGLLGAISIFADITALKSTQARLERYADERALMARAADLFASTLEVDVVLAELARMVVPRIGDWCAIDVVDPTAPPFGGADDRGQAAPVGPTAPPVGGADDRGQAAPVGPTAPPVGGANGRGQAAPVGAGVVRRVIVHHRDPAMIELAEQLEARYPTPPESSTGLHAVIRTGKTQYLGEITEAMLVAGVRDPEHLALLRKINLRSFVVAPIACRGEVFGAITVVTSESAHLLTPDDVKVIEELATRAALSVANARLYLEAHGKAAALEVERKALAASNAELDQFAYAASHDLRAPLRGIGNLASWIEEDLGAQIPATVAANLALLRGRVARMDNLINAILALSRAGRVKTRPEPIELGELVHEVTDLLGILPPARVVVHGTLPLIVAERAGLQQVLLNLIGNAVKHATRAEVEVGVSCTVRADEIEVAIADNGDGIAAEHHERVWKMFQTLRPRDVAENTGIGLALVRKHVEAAGGRAWIDPAVTTGVTFRFTWPIRPTA